MQCLDKLLPITDNPDSGNKHFYTENSKSISWYAWGAQFIIVSAIPVRAGTERACQNGIDLALLGSDGIFLL